LCVYCGILLGHISPLLFVWWCLMPLSTIFQLYHGIAIQTWTCEHINVILVLLCACFGVPRWHKSPFLYRNTIVPSPTTTGLDCIYPMLKDSPWVDVWQPPIGPPKNNKKKTKKQMNTICSCHIHVTRGRRCCDRMVVWITTTYAINAYHHWCCEFESWSGKGVQQYVIKFVSNLWQVGGFLWVLRFPPPIKLTATI
jgi:hypothetical protein